MSRFTKVLVVSPLSDGRTWVLREEFGYDLHEEGSGDTVDVPVGFVTDFASVPRALWWLLPTWGRYGNAAVIHDFCYWDQSRGRCEADRIFWESMQVLGVRRWARVLLFSSVRLFGWAAWWGNRRRRRRSVVKITARMPEKSAETRHDHIRQMPRKDLA
jgi:hypothetical protein